MGFEGEIWLPGCIKIAKNVYQLKEFLLLKEKSAPLK